MSFFTNKHVIVALLAAPVLAVLSYVGVDHMVKPAPITAQPGQSFPLAARSNCRYASGKCTLINGDFSLELQPQLSNAGKVERIILQSEQPIQGVRFALLDANGKTLHSASTSAKSLPLEANTASQIATIQLAIKSNDVIYYAETQANFLNQESL